ncbi:MAG: hypothetical protein CRU78_06080 [Candidatus Accumulibacter phosphatis]|uniref:Uncharacterized protein n=1 Tax=Candidatus Accumulibacter phosphatis TaxID=327160 RepID=A0A6A7RRP5_9PROT|nr:hypothetical protein [Candidatus Accumulibacter phosphatis]
MRTPQVGRRFFRIAIPSGLLSAGDNFGRSMVTVNVFSFYLSDHSTGRADRRPMSACFSSLRPERPMGERSASVSAATKASPIAGGAGLVETSVARL